MSTKTALVLRATGVQGSGVTRHLLKAGWEVHGLAQKIDDARATKLKSLGATLFQGSLADVSTIESAIQGCTALFLNQMPSLTDDSETREASTVLSMAKAAGVKHIVHSTTLPLNNPDTEAKLRGSIVAPAVLDKGKVEQLVRGSGIPWTIIRPGYFMSNFLVPLVDIMFPELRNGTFHTSMAPGTVLPLINPEDIGAFAAAAFQDPGAFSGKIVSVAGQKLSIEVIMSEISRATGKKIDMMHRPKEETEKEKDNVMIAAQVALTGLDEMVDINQVKSWGIPLSSFVEFLEKHKDELRP